MNRLILGGIDVIGLVEEFDPILSFVRFLQRDAHLTNEVCLALSVFGFPHKRANSRSAS